MADRTPGRCARQRKRRTAARVLAGARLIAITSTDLPWRRKRLRIEPLYCERCHDGDGWSVFPYYGIAPHTHDFNDVTHPTDWLGSTRLLPKSQWPANFEPDAEDNGCGTYTHCLHCGAGL